MITLPVPETGFNYLRKSLRGLSYLAFVVGSAFGIFYPGTTITSLSSEHFAVAWAGFFLVSSLICFVGVAMQNWVVEYIGLPMLSGVFLVFSVCLFASVGPQTMNLLTFGFVTLGVAFHLFFRFIELGRYVKRSK